MLPRPRICNRLQSRLLAALFLFLLFPPSAESQPYQWVRRLTSSASDEALGVATGPGGVYMVGETAGSLPGGTRAGAKDAFVAKYDPAGNEQWVRQFGTSVDDSATSVAADSTGVYVAGTTRGTLSGTSAGSADGFVRKYDPNGNELWTRQFGTASDDEALGIASDGTGVYVVGKTQGLLAPSPTPGGDAFIRKYDASGNVVWTRQFGTGSTDDAHAVAADTSGVYVAGRTNAALGATTVGGFDIFVRKYDASGNAGWTTQFGTNTTDNAYAVAVNASGVYVGGDTTGAFPGTTKVGGLYDAYIARLDLNGTQQWVRQIGTAYEDTVYGIAASSSGIFAVGFAEDPLPGQTADGLFVRRYDSGGNETGTMQFAGAGSDFALAAAADGSGVYVCGSVHGSSIAFFPRPPAFTDRDGFIFKIPNPPEVSQGGIVNNGSFAPSPAPVAPGSIAAIFGTNLNDGTTVLSSNFAEDGRLTRTLGGARVTVNDILAPIFYSTPGQLGIQIPFEVTGTSATIRVTVAGQTSAPRTVAISSIAPGIFTASNDGKGMAAMLHQDGVTPITPQNPARRNEVVVLFVTGLGGVTPPLGTGEPATANRVGNPVVTIDGVSAAIDYAGAAPGFVGLNQVNLRIPANARVGSLPLVLTMSGTPSNAVTIPVAAE